MDGLCTARDARAQGRTGGTLEACPGGTRETFTALVGAFTLYDGASAATTHAQQRSDEPMKIGVPDRAGAAFGRQQRQIGARFGAPAVDIVRRHRHREAEMPEAEEPASP